MGFAQGPRCPLAAASMCGVLLGHSVPARPLHWTCPYRWVMAVLKLYLRLGLLDEEGRRIDEGVAGGRGTL
jgi:hypothetical protein